MFFLGGTGGGGGYLVCDKYEQKKFHSMVLILKQVKSDISVTDGCPRRFCLYGVILK